MPISSDELRGYTDTIILVRLEGGDSYGYDINKEIRRLSGGACELKEATLYTAFRRMEAEGLICSYWGDSEGGARRRYYRITDKGRETLKAQLENWRETKLILDRLLTKEGEEDA